jgi:hypothetical protein
LVNSFNTNTYSCLEENPCTIPDRYAFIASLFHSTGKELKLIFINDALILRECRQNNERKEKNQA